MPEPLPAPATGRDAAERFVADRLTGLYSDEVAGSESFSGGQGAADAALAGFNVAGYASSRSEVWPSPRQGASRLSPYIRHGLLTLPQVWSHVGDKPSRDVTQFRDELRWQEYARHWYARLGTVTRHSLRHEPVGSTSVTLNQEMACIDLCTEELESDGWLVNQARMWMASHWTVREKGRWQDGEQYFFTHLLDGSRAANRLGWQWTTGAGSSKQYGFSRWQVEKRAPGLCGQCELSPACPVEHWPEFDDLPKVEPHPLLRRTYDITAEAGPAAPHRRKTPDVVWLTAESMALHDPALAANPDLPVVFVFDEPLLSSLQLSAKRLVFLVETLAGIAEQREVRLYRDRPRVLLAGHTPAVTFAPVPGFARIAHSLSLGEVHPFPWLSRPTGGSVASFSAWRKGLGV
ncbi:MAG: deoxyribodipyrimidine photolyase [Acidimicrobiales bacterium]|nr:deoxyribodipyrimidine photolyase [Acidimicrobiales bacterium]